MQHNIFGWQGDSIKLDNAIYKLDNTDLKVMPIETIIQKVKTACKQCGAESLELFGSFATGTAAPRSDIDFVVYGDVDNDKLDKMIDEIETLRKIDIFYYNEINDEYLLEDIKKYGRKIY